MHILCVYWLCVGLGFTLLESIWLVSLSRALITLWSCFDRALAWLGLARLGLVWLGLACIFF